MFSDLHIHSHYSIDGKGSLESLLRNEILNKFEYVAIADHNTLHHHSKLNKCIDSYPSFKKKLIYACEISCSIDFSSEEYHVLAYWREQPSPRLAPQIYELIDEIRIVSNQQFLLMLEEFNTLERDHILEYWNDYKAIELDDSIVNQPFIFNLYNRSLNGINSEKFKKKRRDIKHNIKMSLAWPRFPSSKKVINCIETSNGVAVLAHPSRYNFAPDKLDEIINKLKEEGILGLEIDSKMITNYCMKYDLFSTTGSDLHDILLFGKNHHIDTLNLSVNILPFVEKLNNV